MALTRTYSINYTTDYVTKDSATEGAIKKLDLDLTAAFAAFVDEDDMASNSNSKFPSQQSVVAYIATKLADDVDSLPDMLMLGGL